MLEDILNYAFPCVFVATCVFVVSFWFFWIVRERRLIRRAEEFGCVTQGKLISVDEDYESVSKKYNRILYGLNISYNGLHVGFIHVVASYSYHVNGVDYIAEVAYAFGNISTSKNILEEITIYYDRENPQKYTYADKLLLAG